MQTEEYERMYRLEDSYWWFIGRHSLVTGFLQLAYPDRRDLTILDIGCGTGAMSAKLAEHGNVVSADFSQLALTFSRKRNLNRLCASDAIHLPFRSESFDVVVAMDILEHVEDDHAAIMEIQRVLKSGGRVISTVPAYRSLWSAHDVALMHHRRYTAAELRRLFESAALKIEKLTYAMTLLFPIVWLVRRLTRKSAPKSSLMPVPGIANRILVGILNAENALLKRARMPFGVSVFCMARKSER
jgi:2-polyprenyl-3-methyl-5-hydroxy-6-metoxy-1,4-benzoquinol methylase